MDRWIYIYIDGQKDRKKKAYTLDRKKIERQDRKLDCLDFRL